MRSTEPLVCKVCGGELGNIRDYCLVLHKPSGEKFVEFSRVCRNLRCRDKKGNLNTTKYFRDLDFNNEYYLFDKKDIIKVEG